MKGTETLHRITDEKRSKNDVLEADSKQCTNEKMSLTIG